MNDEPSLSPNTESQAAAEMQEGALLVGIKLAGFFLEYVSHIVLARGLGAADYGGLACVLSMAELAIVLSLWGKDKLTLKCFAVFLEQARLGEARGYLIGNARVILIMSVVVTILGHGIDHLFIASGHPFHFHQHSLLLLVCYIGLAALAEFLSQVLVASGFGITAFIWTYLVPPLLLLIFVATALALGGPLGESRAFLLVSAGWSVALLGLGTSVYRHIWPRLQNKEPIQDLPQWFRMGGAFLIVEFAIAFLENGSIVFMRALGESDVSMALFSAVMQTVYLQIALTMAVSIVLLPRFALCLEHRDRLLLKRYLLQAFFSHAVISLGCLLIFGYQGSAILRLFGGAFVEARTALWIAVAGTTCSTMLGLITTVLQYAGHDQLVTYSYLIGVGGFTALNIVFVPRWGLTGAAAAVSITLTVLTAWHLYLLITRVLRDPGGVR